MSYRDNTPDTVEFWKGLGRRIIGTRTAAGITQQQLADFIGLGRSSVANIEAGRQRVPVTTLIKIARRLEVSLDALVFGDRGGAA